MYICLLTIWSEPRNAAIIDSNLLDFVISKWCASRRLQLNAKQTEVLWFGTVVELSKMDPFQPTDRCLTISSEVIQPLNMVQDLGVYLNAHPSMNEHAAQIARTGLYHLHHQRSIPFNLGREVTTRLDYSNSVLTYRHQRWLHIQSA